MYTVVFQGRECTLEFGRYMNDRISIQLWSKMGPMGRATVNVPDVVIADNHVIVKDYSENTGMLTALVKADIVEEIGRIPIGFSEGILCRLKVSVPVV